MQPEVWKRAEQIFNQAVFLPPEVQPAFVEEKTGEDAEVRDVVLRLLLNDNQGEAFFDESVFTFGAQILAAEEDERLLRQKDFASYHLLEIIGRGGMGVVFLARDKRLERKVAIKLLPRAFIENLSLRKRFEREARIAASISHPNIAHIYETGEFDSQPFIAMEYVEGKTLRELLSVEKKLPAEGAVQIAAQIVSALAAAHRAGITHRDIKPENVMMHPDGYVKVLDFGIAKIGAGSDGFSEKQDVSDTAENLTGHGELIGTTRYMSPEQLTGEEIDERTDIWSLGAVLYEMLTGTPPFEGDNKSELIAAILEKEPPEIVNLKSSPALRKTLRRMLTKSKHKRYQSAAEAYSNLQNSPENSKKSQASLITAAALFSGRSVLFAVMILLTIAIIGSVYLSFREGKKSIERTSLNPLPNLGFTHFNDDGRVLCSALSPDAGQIAYALEKDGSQSILLRETKSGEIREIIAPSATNDFESICLTFSPSGDFIYYGVYENESLDGMLYRVPVSGGEPQFLRRKIDSPVSFSPDGRQMVFLLAEKTREKLIIADSDGNELKTIVERAEPLFLSYECYPSWSPDGQTIAFSDGISAGKRQMFAAIYDVTTGKVRNLTDYPFYEVKNLSWLAEGDSLLITARHEGETASQLFLVDYPSGEVKRLIQDLFDYYSLNVARGTGRLVTVAAEDVAQLWTLDVGNQDSAKQISTGRNDGQGAAWTSNDSLVFGSNSGGSWDLWMMRSDGSNLRQLTNDPAFDTDPAAASDGSFVVFSSTRGGIYHLWRLNLFDNSLTQLTKGTGEYYPQVSPDNQWAVFHRQTPGEPVAVWKVSTEGGPPVQLSSVTTTRADVSPDGKQVVSTYRISHESDPLIGIYSIDGAKNVKTLKPAAGALLFSIPLRWSPDGKQVVYVVRKNGVDNLWSQPINGESEPRPITAFTTNHIYSFDFAPNGKRVALARGNRLSHTVLIEGLE